MSDSKINSKLKKSRNKRRKRLILLGGISIVIIVFTTYTTGKYWVQIYDKYQENSKLDRKLRKLKKKEEALRVDVGKMQDADYVARYAREKYLYSKDGEFILSIK